MNTKSKKSGKSIPEKVDAHTHVADERFVLRPPFPDSIKIEITGRCNYSCSFCAQSKGLRKIGDMDRNFLYRILWEAKSIGVKEIGLFLLGESFLVKDLAEYIKYAKEVVGIEYVFITTNGYLCTPERTIPVIEAGLDSLKFSFNAGEKERYKKMHGVDGFDKVVNNIKWLHSYLEENNITSLRTCVSSIYTEELKDELDGLKKMISPYVDDHYYLPLYNQAGHVGGEAYTKIIGNPGRLDNMVNSIPCWALFNGAKITFDGWLTACYFDHDNRFNIADLNKVSLMKAWHHPKIVEARRNHLENNFENSICSDCVGASK